jgi:hypothetical protein
MGFSVVGWGSLTSPSALAQATQPGKADTLDPAQIKARAQRIKDMRALLSDPDQNVRLAALDEMIKSGDPVMQEVAFETGFASADSAMRSVALRAKIAKIKALTIEVSPPSGGDAAKALNDVGGQTQGLPIKSFDAATGAIVFDGYNSPSGQVSGSELSIRWANKAARFRLESGAMLKGSITGPNVATLPATIRLN